MMIYSRVRRPPEDVDYLTIQLRETVPFDFVEGLVSDRSPQPFDLACDYRVVHRRTIPGEVREQLVQAADDGRIRCPVLPRLSDRYVEVALEGRPGQDDPRHILIASERDRAKLVIRQLSEQARGVTEGVHGGGGIVDSR